MRKEEAEPELTPEEKKRKRLEAATQRNLNWKRWRNDGDKESDEEEDKNLEEVELTEAFLKALTDAERQEREKEQEEERIVKEFQETGTAPCWNCAHEPCLCSLTKLEMRLEMLKDIRERNRNRERSVNPNQLYRINLHETGEPEIDQNQDSQDPWDPQEKSQELDPCLNTKLGSTDPVGTPNHQAPGHHAREVHHGPLMDPLKTPNLQERPLGLQNPKPSENFIPEAGQSGCIGLFVMIYKNSDTKFVENSIDILFRNARSP